MSPLAFHRKIHTPVRLNPPWLEYTTQPSDAGTIDYDGSATFIGIATVNYHVTGVGTIGYEWKDSTGVIGVGTELTLTNLTEASGREITQYAIYYPDATRAGIETFQPDAVNSPLASDTNTLAIKSKLTITQQPTPTEAGTTIASGLFTVSPATPNGTTSINLSTGDFSDFECGTVYTLTPSVNMIVAVTAQGGAGGGFGNSAGSASSNSSIAGLTGGKGGGIKGNVTFQEGYTYILIRGCAGSGVESQNNSGGSPGGGTAYIGDEATGPAGSGGGYSAIFQTSATWDNVLLIAGAGGGFGYTKNAYGGDGGNLASGGSGQGVAGGGDYETGGSGGLNDGLGGQAGNMGLNTGTKLAGASNQNNNPSLPGGAGGAGYYGGGQGGEGVVAAGGGGGGSSYSSPILVNNASYLDNSTFTGHGAVTLSFTLVS